MTAPGRFVWHELITVNPTDAEAFYTDVVGWSRQDFPMGHATYRMIVAGGVPIGGIVPMDAAAGIRPHWVASVTVDNVEEALQRAIDAGGRKLSDPMDVPDVGRMVGMADPQGAIIQAYAATTKVELPDNHTQGAISWDELITRNPDGARDFYTRVFGWKTRQDQYDWGGYTVFTSDDGDHAGMLDRPSAEAPPEWIPYVTVADVDDAVARAQKGGGKVHMEPVDIKNVGRAAVLVDPQGAAFGLWQGARAQ
jgi:hypothetical protein